MAGKHQEILTPGAETIGVIVQLRMLRNLSVPVAVG